MSAHGPARRGAADGEGGFATLTFALGAAAAIELLVLRSFTRTAIHIPALEELAGPYRVVTWFGRFDYYVAVVLLVMALPVAAVALGRVSPRAGVAAGGAVGLFAASAVLARFGAAGDTMTGWLAVASVAAMTLVVAMRAPQRGAALGVYALAFVLAGTSAYAEMRHAGNLLWSAEVLAVAAGLAVPLAFGLAYSRAVVVAGVTAGLLIFAMLVGSGPTTRILLLWNEGMTGALPAVAYGAAAAGVAATVVSLYRRGELLAAAGLLLAVMGGIGLHNTYQTGLAVAGLAVLAVAGPGRSPVPAAAPSPAPAAVVLVEG